MKGLLLKDLYLAVRYCRAFLILEIVFLTVAFFGKANVFFIVYPTLVSGILPMSLLSYDERDKWNQYCETLPCSRAQVVSVKYIIGLLFSGVTWLISMTATVVRMVLFDSFSIRELLFWGEILLVLGVIGPMLLLPFVFKLGVEKGRILFYVMIGLLCAISVVVNSVGLQTSIASGNPLLLTIIAAAGILLYLLSWRLSIMFYKQREL